jgi:phosphoglycerol transferase
MRIDRRCAGALARYATVAALSLVAAIFVLDLRHADLRIPFDYYDDALLYSFMVRTVVDRGWFWNNPMGGAPLGFDLHDYPVAAQDTVHLVLIRIMAFVSHDWALLLNLYFLLGFPLIAVVAFAVFRRFNVGTVPAVAASVLFAFLPSRLLVGELHLFLDVFFQVPIAVLLMLLVCEADPPLFAAPNRGRRLPRLDLRSRRTWGALAGAVLVSATSVYYAFFTMLLLGGIGVWAAVERQTWRNLAAGFGLAGVIAAGIFAQGLPTIAYQMRHGPNPEVGRRFAFEAEVYGLKIAPLLLPVTGHRIPELAQIKNDYDASAPLKGENETTSLGSVSTVGFLVLLGFALGSRRGTPPSQFPEAVDGKQPLQAPFRPLAVLTVMAVLLGTVGGFGSLFAVFVSPRIRTYSRINIFIGFFALFAIALLLERLRRRHRLLADLTALAVLAVGLFDQASRFAVRDYAAIARMYASDAAFVQRVETLVPTGAALFQLPPSTFPEPPSVTRMAGYAPLRLLLHARTTRWSYPSMRGRAGATWIADVTSRAPAAMLEAVSDAGFEGVIIDHDGYADRAAALEADLRRVVAVEPAASTDGRLSFFPLTDYKIHRDRIAGGRGP